MGEKKTETSKKKPNEKLNKRKRIIDKYHKMRYKEIILFAFILLILQAWFVYSLNNDRDPYYFTGDNPEFELTSEQDFEFKWSHKLKDIDGKVFAIIDHLMGFDHPNNSYSFLTTQKFQMHVIQQNFLFLRGAVFDSVDLNVGYPLIGSGNETLRFKLNDLSQSISLTIAKPSAIVTQDVLVPDDWDISVKKALQFRFGPFTVFSNTGTSYGKTTLGQSNITIGYDTDTFRYPSNQHEVRNVVEFEIITDFDTSPVYYDLFSKNGCFTLGLMAIQFLLNINVIAEFKRLYKEHELLKAKIPQENETDLKLMKTRLYKSANADLARNFLIINIIFSYIFAATWFGISNIKATITGLLILFMAATIVHMIFMTRAKWLYFNTEPRFNITWPKAKLEYNLYLMSLPKLFGTLLTITIYIIDISDIPGLPSF